MWTIIITRVVRINIATYAGISAEGYPAIYHGTFRERFRAITEATVIRIIISISSTWKGTETINRL